MKIPLSGAFSEPMNRKQNKKKPTGRLSLSPEEEARLRSILEHSPPADPSELRAQVPNPRLAQALLERLPLDHAGAADLALALKAAFPEKPVQKEAKRAIFRLRQSGVTVPDEAKDETPAFRMVASEPTPKPSAHLGCLDGLGERAVFITIPQALSGVSVGMGVISDEKGLLDFLHGRYSKKRAKELREIFFDRVPHMVETSLSHAATVLEAAYARTGTGSDRAARDYLQLRPWLLENVTLLQRPAILDLIPPEDLSGLSPTDTQVEGLLDHEWMKTWIIDPERISPLVEEIVKAEESPILVSPEQKAARIHDLKRLHLERIYPHERRILLKGRLEEMAYLFHKQGETQHARTALAAALSLEEQDSSFRVNPFLQLMIDRSLAYYLKPEQENGTPKPAPVTEGGLILP
jgi:hypothetical protein